MASSSSLSSAMLVASCFHCKTASAVFRQGWQLRDGNYAALCETCASAYEIGRFCDLFHLDAEGWRDCASCKKLVHCGCIMSIHYYVELDFGGIHCMDCEKKAMAMDIATTNTNDLTDGVGKSIDEGVGSSRRNPQHNGENLSKTFVLKLQEDCKESNSIMVFLFEKKLTAWDTKPKNGRIVLPKKCAEAYFPEITDRYGVPISLWDFKDQELKLRFQYWTNSESKMYCLDGLSNYFKINQCKAGDLMKFYRKEPEGKLVIAHESSVLTEDSTKN